MKSLFSIIKTLLFLMLFLVVIPTHAASFIIAGPKEVVTGKPFDVTFYAESAKESINALEGNIIYPANVLELKSIKDGDSIISLWIRQPQITARSTNASGFIPFSGVMTGGTTFSRSKIFTLTFVVKNTVVEVPQKITVQNALAYASNGRGTKLTMTVVPLAVPRSSPTIAGQKSVGQVLSEKVVETNPPQEVYATVTKSDKIFNGSWFLAFTAKDVESGIDHFEIQETLADQSNPNNWVSSTNPYRLEDQKLQSYIFIKAIDRSGNEKTIRLNPSISNKVNYPKIIFWCIVSASIISIYLLWYRRQRNGVTAK